MIGHLYLKHIWIYVALVAAFINFNHAGRNKCPEVKGCVCDEIYNVEGTRFICNAAEDPPLHLIPHENITALSFIRSTFHNISAMYEIRKTNAKRILMLQNNFMQQGMNILDWEWLPSTLFNLSLTDNGFNGFKNKNETGTNCRLQRFRNNLTLQIKEETIPGIPECLPATLTTLVLNNIYISNKTNHTTRWPRQIYLFKTIGSAFANISKDLINTPDSLKIIWINLAVLNKGQWPSALPAKSIEKLILTHSGMSIISPKEMERFKKADVLKYLMLNYNNLRDIPENLPSSLESLHMSHNKIYYVSPENWVQLKNLKILDLTNNFLVVVPMGMPSSLQTIYFHGNSIGYSDPEAFSLMTKLEVLDLSDNKLSSMPRGIPRSIRKYIITHNRISIVQGPGDYNFCVNCSIFELKANPWYCNVEMLQMLSWLIRYNISIGTAKAYGKDDSENVAHCSEIAIKGIDISWLNTAIEYMEYIKLPPNDKCIYEIEYLTCQDAGLNALPEMIPPNLEKVNISGNPDLTYIPEGKFATQKELEKLILNNNSITHFPYGLPESLVELELQDNNLGNWTARDLIALQNLTKLRQLYLENNNIKVIYAHQFEGLTEMNWIGLSRNPLHCDCSLQSFQIWFTEISPRDSKFMAPSFPTCETPSSQNGMDIRQLTGHFMYGLQCASTRCSWYIERTTLNCSRGFLEGNITNMYIPKYEEGVAPEIPRNSYWIGLDLSGLKLKSEQIMYGHLVRLEVVNLTDNLLTQFPLTGLPQRVKELNLSHNLIEHLPSTYQIKNHLPNIKILDLRNNRIKHLDSVEIGTLEFVNTLLLSGNPFICNCSLRTLVEWIHVNKENTKMVKQHQLQKLTCKTSERSSSKIIRMMYAKDEDFCPDLPIAAIIVGIIAFILIVVITMFVVHLYMQKQRNKQIQEEILLGFQGLLEKEEKEAVRDPETGMGTEKDLKFDAFVSYDADGADAEFVLTLLEELEDKRGYKLCLNERDFMPGAGITDNIVECIGSSKRIILILSRTFASSPWCQYEVQVALAELHQRRKSQLLISLLLEDISVDEDLASSVRTFLTLVPSISVPAYNSNSDEVWKDFWSDLLGMMPNPSNVV